MPYMYVNSATQQEFEYVAKDLVDELAGIFKIGPERFVFIKNNNSVIKNKSEHKDIFIEIKCFERPEEQVVQMGNFLIDKYSEKWNKDIKVMFIFMDKKNFFAKG